MGEVLAGGAAGGFDLGQVSMPHIGQVAIFLLVSSVTVVRCPPI